MMEIAAYSLIAIGLLFLMLDWRQTLYIARHPMEYRELNRFLGEHPTERAVSRYFFSWLAGIVATFVVAMVNDLAILGVFGGAMLAAVEGYWVVQNFRIGIRL